MTPDTTTAVCTSTAPPDLTPAVDGLVEQVEERAAILEFDAGYPREVAERLAREMVMGRDAPQVPAVVETVGVDHAVLAARMHPFVDRAVRSISGTVGRLLPEDDPFPAGAARDTAPRPPGGACRCGASDWSDVPIHDGRSARRECAGCGSFLRWAVWYGRPCDDRGVPIDKPARAAPKNRVFVPLPAADDPPVIALPTGPISAGAA